MTETSVHLNPDALASLVSRDVLRADASQTFATIGRRYRAYEKSTGRAPAVLVFEDDRLIGALPNSALILRKATERISRYIRPIATMTYRSGRRTILHTFREHPHDKVAVIDDSGEVVGVIYSDDMLRVLQEQDAASLFTFAGVQQEEAVNDPARQKVLHRYKWLIINLATAFFAAFTVGIFEDTIAKHVLLAVYMPIVAGMGGNAATQTLAVLVRGLALREIELRTAARALWNEVCAGLANGLINGVIVAMVVFALHRDVMLAVVLSLAMVVNLVVAGFFGTLVPLIMKRLGKDPATSATIFITTATDVLGFLAFLGLATWLLR